MSAVAAASAAAKAVMDSSHAEGTQRGYESKLNRMRAFMEESSKANSSAFDWNKPPFSQDLIIAFFGSIEQDYSC